MLQRVVGNEIEFLAVTLWDSIESIQAFTGPDPAVAVVEPEEEPHCHTSTSLPELDCIRAGRKKRKILVHREGLEPSTN